MPEEQAVQQEEFRVPPYFERLQEERDRRFSSEIARLEGEIRHNGERIAELREVILRLGQKIDDVRDELKGDIARLDQKIDDVRDELKGDIARLDQKIDDVRDELKGDIAELRAELKGDIARLDQKIDDVRDELRGDIARLERRIERLEDQMEQLRATMQGQFRWMMGLLLPIVVGVVALLVQNLFLNP